MTMEWTAKRTEKLAELWKSGVTTSEIGRKLKVTKNAVVGKAHRLGLPQRQSPIPGKARKPSKAGPARASRKASAKPTARAPVKAAKKVAVKAVKKVVKKVVGKAVRKAAGKAVAKPSAKAAGKKPTKAVAPKAAPKAASKSVPSAAKPTAKATPAPTKTPPVPTKVAPTPVPVETAHLTQTEAPRPDEAHVVRLENLNSSMCCWPIGEPGTPDFRFCGKRPTVPDKPYCLEHCMRAYVKSSKDRRDSTPKPVPTTTTA